MHRAVGFQLLLMLFLATRKTVDQLRENYRPASEFCLAAEHPEAYGRSVEFET